MRPWLKLFLIFCFIYFKNVIVWSAGQPRYVMGIVDILFRDSFPPLIIYTQTDTEFEDDYTRKPLQKIFDDPRLVSCNITERNTFVIDDKKETFFLNEDNGILIPAYEPMESYEELSTNDPSLLQLIYWLLKEDVMKSTDVRNLNKANIFRDSYHLESIQKCRIINGKLHCLSEEVFKIIAKTYD